MVEGIFGLPGQGKSTYLAKLAKKANKKGVIRTYSLRASRMRSKRLYRG